MQTCTGVLLAHNKTHKQIHTTHSGNPTRAGVCVPGVSVCDTPTELEWVLSLSIHLSRQADWYVSLAHSACPSDGKPPFFFYWNRRNGLYQGPKINRAVEDVRIGEKMSLSSLFRSGVSLVLRERFWIYFHCIYFKKIIIVIIIAY